jgi:hypothetical protein
MKKDLKEIEQNLRKIYEKKVKKEKRKKKIRVSLKD